MLRTRLWMGSILIAVAAGMLALDQHLPPWYPFQLVLQLFLAIASLRELLLLLGPDRAPQAILAFAGIVVLTLTNWVVPWLGWPHRVWFVLIGVVTAGHLLGPIVEMALFRAPGQSIERMARTWWAVGYLGLLPCFIAQLRLLFEPGNPLGTQALALAIFVPKGCDIGAYFTGKLLGRRPMAPLLSPKKTWEGTLGGMIVACLVAILIDRAWSPGLLGHHLLLEIACGITVGLAGLLGDLAESLIKRDCQRKDASAIVPGFGGILDVVDAIIFAGPVVYLWCLLRFPP